MTAAQLLAEQLTDALDGSQNEDRQGEPDEFWWNTMCGLKRSFCLFDSDWDTGDIDAGFLSLRYSAKGGASPFFKAAVSEVQDRDRKSLFAADPNSYAWMRKPKTLKIPWIRLEERFFPNDVINQVNALLARDSWPKKPSTEQFATGFSGQMFAVQYQSELQFQSDGTAWMIGLSHGPKRAFKNGARPIVFNTIPTFRSGPSDIGARSNAFTVLNGKNIAIFGVGALGGPLALEVAKNGCAQLNLIDDDIVEPGNSIRWPLGTSAWGEKKVDALSNHISSNYGWCTSHPCDLGIGRINSEKSENGILTKIISEADLIVDATASSGVTALLYDFSAQYDKTLISLWATPSLEGGAVVKYVPKKGCPICLEHHFYEGSIVEPAGTGKETGLIQPPGCSERTFSGSSFDLGEITLEAMRLIVATLREANAESAIKTVSIASDPSQNLPSWQFQPFSNHKNCSCT